VVRGSGIGRDYIDAGLRKAQTSQARAVYDQDVASYRQTVLTAFGQVEDNLAALRILEQEAQVQDEACRMHRSGNARDQSIQSRDSKRS